MCRRGGDDVARGSCLARVPGQLRHARKEKDLIPNAAESGVRVRGRKKTAAWQDEQRGRKKIALRSKRKSPSDRSGCREEGLDDPGER